MGNMPQLLLLLDRCNYNPDFRGPSNFYRLQYLVTPMPRPLPVSCLDGLNFFLKRSTREWFEIAGHFLRRWMMLDGTYKTHCKILDKTRLTGNMPPNCVFFEIVATIIQTVRGHQTLTNYSTWRLLLDDGIIYHAHFRFRRIQRIFLKLFSRQWFATAWAFLTLLDNT